MKNSNSKKFTPFTYLAIVFGLFLAFTDDYIVEYLSNRPTLGIIFVVVLIIGFIYFVGSKKLKHDFTSK